MYIRWTRKHEDPDTGCAAMELVAEGATFANTTKNLAEVQHLPKDSTKTKQAESCSTAQPEARKSFQGNTKKNQSSQVTLQDDTNPMKERRCQK